MSPVLRPGFVLVPPFPQVQHPAFTIASLPVRSRSSRTGNDQDSDNDQDKDQPNVKVSRGDGSDTARPQSQQPAPDPKANPEPEPNPSHNPRPRPRRKHRSQRESSGAAATTSTVPEPLRRTVTAAGLLFDPRHTSRQAPPPAPRGNIVQEAVNTDTASFSTLPSATMDAKRHPSSFQQLEKLGEGTYATVRADGPRPLPVSCTDD